MAMSMSQFGQDPDYARFLAASVGADGTGANVSVLSMLARLELDPWTEAADLAAMLDAPARKRLEALLARFDDVPIQTTEQGRIASDLLAFLPRRARIAPQASDGAVAQSAKLAMGSPIYWIVAAVLLFGWIAAMAQGS